ncbi:MAG: hypothetical protein C0514_03095 [Candidatus Puniceispirillum sp.]|nr:hypothetical protein [Candidatus Puniceispirillum sp.]
MLKHLRLALLTLSTSVSLMASASSIDEAAHAGKSAHTITVHKEAALYSAQLEADLFFVLERQTPVTRPFWEDYAQRQLASRNLGGKVFKKAGGSAAEPFQKSLLHTGISDIYVAYACYSLPILDGKPAHEDTRDGRARKNIEMSFAVLTDNGCAPAEKSSLPWVTHMGIQRSMFAVEAGKPQHKNLAMRLHSFTAACMLSFCPEKEYLITNPLQVMRNLMAKAMPEGSVYLGSSRFPTWLYERQEALEEDRTARASSKEYAAQVQEIDELLEYVKNQAPESPLTIAETGGAAHLRLANGDIFTIPRFGNWLFGGGTFEERNDLPYAIADYRALASLHFEGASFESVTHE